MINKLITDYDSYIKKIIKMVLKAKTPLPHIIEYDDLYQECMLCLCNIAKTNPEPQYQYVTKSLRVQIANYIKKILPPFPYNIISLEQYLDDIEE